MTNKQPEALRLADALLMGNAMLPEIDLPEAAAELRRQHTELQNAYATIESLKDAVSRAQTEAARYANPMVVGQRDELLEALKAERALRVIGQQPDVHWESLRDMRRSVYDATDAAIAKVKGSAA